MTAEYGERLDCGCYHLWHPDPEQVISDDIEFVQADGGQVYHRWITVLEDWTEVPRDTSQ